ncbi:MAG: radical SAM protein [Spirochaetia bacterium]|jgi:radical SAM protein with 4Fe4S-binding SPASM domain
MAEDALPRRFLLQWHLTDSCNLSCRHCYDEAGQPKPELPLEQLVAFLRQYIRFLDANGITGHINFTGGEPFLRDDLPELLREVRRHHETVSYAILSNGTMIDGPCARLLRRTGCRFVQISVDGGPETHDALRGPGTFNACRRALGTLRRHGIPTMMSFTVSRVNWHDFPDVVRMACEEGANVVWSDRLLPLGRGAEMTENLLTAQEVDRFFETMFRSAEELRNRQRCPTRVRMHRALQFRTLISRGVKNVIPYRCNAGRGLLSLMPDGRILPCRRMPVTVGFFGRDSLEEVYREAPFLRTLRAEGRVAAGCEDCAWRASCGGGLRCLAYARGGDPFRADPQCSLAREARERGEAARSNRVFRRD